MQVVQGETASSTPATQAMSTRVKARWPDVSQPFTGSSLIPRTRVLPHRKKLDVAAYTGFQAAKSASKSVEGIYDICKPSGLRHQHLVTGVVVKNKIHKAIKQYVSSICRRHP